MEALARYLAQPVERYDAAAAADASSLSAMLVSGDVLLTDGNTRIAALVRCITRSAWAHVCMYVGPLEEGPDPRCIVEADIAAGVRAIPLSDLNGLRVRVLRPTGLPESDRRRIAEWVVSRIGDEYDLAHALALGRRLLLPLASRLAPAPHTVAQGARRFICSSLLAQAFMLVGYPIASAASMTPRDFERASGFEVVNAEPGRVR
jgi:hypothetical protein